MATPTEMAHEAQKQIATLRAEFDIRQTVLEKLNLSELRERIAVLEDRVTELKKSKEEADRRYWQFVVLFVGGILTLAINLVVSFVRK